MQAAAIGAHLLGAAELATTNKGRVAGQKGAGKVADARLGEQQRPTEVLRGMVARAVPDSIGDALPSLPDSLTDVLPSPTTLAGVTAAVKGLPEAARHLPDTARELVSH